MLQHSNIIFFFLRWKALQRIKGKHTGNRDKSLKVQFRVKNPWATNLLFKGNEVDLEKSEKSKNRFQSHIVSEDP